MAQKSSGGSRKPVHGKKAGGMPWEKVFGSGKAGKKSAKKGSSGEGKKKK